MINEGVRPSVRVRVIDVRDHLEETRDGRDDREPIDLRAHKEEDREEEYEIQPRSRSEDQNVKEILDGR